MRSHTGVSLGLFTCDYQSTRQDLLNRKAVSGSLCPVPALQMNWYTKRAALTGIFNTSELVMVQDSSPDFQDTWNFLDNRIQDVVNMASTAKQVESGNTHVVITRHINVLIRKLPSDSWALFRLLVQICFLSDPDSLRLMLGSLNSVLLFAQTFTNTQTPCTLCSAGPVDR